MTFTCKSEGCTREVSAYQFSVCKYGCYCHDCACKLEHPEQFTSEHAQRERERWRILNDRLLFVLFPYDGWEVAAPAISVAEYIQQPDPPARMFAMFRSYPDALESEDALP